MTLPMISASKIKTYRTCHRQYYHKYVTAKADRPIEDKNVGALLGTALHKAIQQRYENDDDPLQVFQTVMHSTLDEWESQGLVVKGVEWFSKSLKDGKAILRGFEWDRFVPIALELEFTLPFPNSNAPIALVNGYIDMVNADGSVVDHKSQRRRPTQDQLNHDSQFVFYAWAVRELYGSLPSAVIWNHLRTNKLVNVDVLTDFDFKLGQLIIDVDAMINVDKYPRRQMDDICMKECSFYSLCYGQRAKDIVEVEEE
jgi:hypothetical protein